MILLLIIWKKDICTDLHCNNVQAMCRPNISMYLIAEKMKHSEHSFFYLENLFSHQRKKKWSKNRTIFRDSKNSCYLNGSSFVPAEFKL
jgi:hypothetical protein